MQALRDVTKARHAITEVVSCQLFFFFFFLQHLGSKKKKRDCPIYDDISYLYQKFKMGPRSLFSLYYFSYDAFFSILVPIWRLKKLMVSRSTQRLNFCAFANVVVNGHAFMLSEPSCLTRVTPITHASKSRCL